MIRVFDIALQHNHICCPECDSDEEIYTAFYEGLNFEDELISDDILFCEACDILFDWITDKIVAVQGQFRVEY